MYIVVVMGTRIITSNIQSTAYKHVPDNFLQILTVNDVFDNFEASDKKTIHDVNQLNQFMPSVDISLLDSSDQILPLDEIDPDSNYLNDIVPNFEECKYYIEDTFNTVHKDVPHNSFSMIHSNVRSAPKNLSQFQLYLESLDVHFTVIGLCETWFDDTKAEIYNISGYSAVHNCRAVRRGGGVSIFVTDGLNFKKRNDLCLSTDHCECIFLEFAKSDVNYDKNVIVGVVYRPTDGSITVFNESLQNILTSMVNENKYCYVMGDFNINLLNVDKNIQVSEFMEIMTSMSYFPLICKPTRISTSKKSGKITKTLIDNIFTNYINCDSSSHGIFCTDISDHFPIFAINKQCITNKPQSNFITVRDYSEGNIVLFKEKLQQHDWSNIFTQSDTQIAFSNFHDIYMSLYNACFPWRKIKSSYKNRKVWLSPALKQSIKTKNKLFAKYKKQPFLHHLKTYKAYRNKLNRLLKNAERKHYECLLEENKNNMKKSWKIISEVINKKIKHTSASVLKIDNDIIENKMDIANYYNSFFTSIGPKLSENIKSVSVDPTSYIYSRSTDSIFLEPISIIEIKNVVFNLKLSSPGYDGICANFLKCSFDEFVEPLTYIFNLSFKNGICPDELKIARVIPIYKSGDKTIVSNYRPVSVLPIFSKIIERLMYDRLISFINRHNLIYEHQFGFRKNYSTNMAIITMFDNILNSINKGEYVLGVFLDFSKAFDTVNHSILLDKLKLYGIRGRAHCWLENYLTNRKQYVDNADTISERLPITCGVPQGSILGPLLFILYVNDICNVSKELLPILFADDTNVFINGTDVNYMLKTMNQELEKLVVWLNANKLTLNVNKTHYIVFRLHKKKTVTNIDLTIDGEIVSEVNNTKFLGIVIDNKLNWSEHIYMIKKKASRGLGILCKARKCLSVSVLTTLYYSFIYPYFMYGIEVWGNTFECYLNPLYKLQKRTIRLMLSTSRYAHTAELFVKLKLLTLEKIYIFRVALFMYRYVSGLLPSLFNSMFKYNRDISSYNTRQSALLYLPMHKYSFFSKCLRINGVKIWNSLVIKIECRCSLVSFKYKLKQYLIAN